MAMTKKDYEIVAMIVKSSMLAFRENGRVITEDRADALAEFFSQYLLKGLVLGFEMNYENFNRDKFLNATLPDDI